MTTIEQLPAEDAEFVTFRPEEYLNEYYSTVSGENGKLLEFFAKSAQILPTNMKVLEYGGGPTIYQLLSYAPKSHSIVFGDYLQSNLDAVKSWDSSEVNSHDWTPFTSAALVAESGIAPSSDEIANREKLLKEKIGSLVHVNAFDATDDGISADRTFDLVSTNFVAESIASTKEQWLLAIDNIASRVASNGWLSMTVIRNAAYWVSGGKRYPGYPVGLEDVTRALQKKGFTIELSDQIDADIMDPNDPSYEGYDGMVFVLARRS